MAESYNRTDVENQVVAVLVAFEKAAHGWQTLVSDVMDDVDRQFAVLMHGRELYFEHVDKKVESLLEMLSKKPLILEYDEHVDTVCMGRDLIGSLESVAGRIQDAEESVRDKIDEMSEWAAFKVMRTKIMEVFDSVCPPMTADELRELVTAATLSMDTMAVQECLGGPDESWKRRALGEVMDPPPEDKATESDATAAAPPPPPHDSSDSSESDRDSWTCPSGRHCPSCCNTDGIPSSSSDDDDVDTIPKSATVVPKVQ
jgi:hypothetical protein